MQNSIERNSDWPHKLPKHKQIAQHAYYDLKQTEDVILVTNNCHDGHYSVARHPQLSHKKNPPLAVAGFDCFMLAR